MAINFSTYDDIVKRVRASISANLPEIDPTIHGSFEKGLADGLSGRSFDIVQLVQQLVKQFFPSTSTDDFLEIWSGYEGLTRNAAVESKGSVVFTGTISSVIPVSTSIKSQATGEIYTTDTELTLANNIISVSSLTRSGTIVTAITASNHGLSTGITADILGAVETEYNGSFVVSVTGLTSFTYTISGTPSSPATGTITADYDGGSVNVTSNNTGTIVNLDSGAKIDLISPISGVNTSSFVQFNGLVNGKLVENDADLLVRILRRRKNPVANFNVGAIENKIFEVPEATRVKVKRITPAEGLVTILFVRDGDINIIPDANQILEVKNKIIEILPATSSTNDVIVKAPIPIITNFTFSSISPDTPTMRVAISNSLKAFYTDEVEFEVDITKEKYNAVIANTIDTVTGDVLNSFTLTTPTTDITVGADSLGLPGVITLP